VTDFVDVESRCSHQIHHSSVSSSLFRGINNRGSPLGALSGESDSQLLEGREIRSLSALCSASLLKVKGEDLLKIALTKNAKGGREIEKVFLPMDSTCYFARELK